MIRTSRETKKVYREPGSKYSNTEKEEKTIKNGSKNAIRKPPLFPKDLKKWYHHE